MNYVKLKEINEGCFHLFHFASPIELNQMFFRRDAKLWSQMVVETSNESKLFHSSTYFMSGFKAI